MKRISSAAICILILSLLVLANEVADSAEQRPTGKNCDLQTPPEDAGEDINHGIIQRIYPRASEISKDYVGCQIVWVADGMTWITIAAVSIERGDPVRVWSPYETDPIRLACRYKEGKLIEGDRARCPAPDHLFAKSLPPGCVERITNAGGRFPPDCSYD